MGISASAAPNDNIGGVVVLRERDDLAGETLPVLGSWTARNGTAREAPMGFDGPAGKVVRDGLAL